MCMQVKKVGQTDNNNPLFQNKNANSRQALKPYNHWEIPPKKHPNVLGF